MLNTEKMAYSIDEFAELSNICRDKLYAAIRAGTLRVRRSGRRTLVLREDGRDFLAGLPVIDPRVDLKRPVTGSRGRSEARSA
jgi:excisionase family DNA binding protein